jgi:hypothetical protein
VTLDSCASDQVAIPKAAFVFCRYTMAALIWLAFLLKIKVLVAVVFVLLVASAVLSIRRAPLVWIYTQTIHRVAKSADEFLSLNGMRIAHSMGAMFAAICLLFLYVLNERIGWALTLVYCVVKTISAIWACPVYKLYACMKSGNCCTFLKKKQA